jgi:hypothetical protein
MIDKGMTFDPKVGIFCAIDNISNSFPNVPSNAGGITIMAPAAHTDPPMCFILYSRLNSIYSNDYDRVRSKVGASIHELGHAIGIDKDDPNIIPPHSGSNSDICTMHSPADPQTFYTNPLFCDGHRDFISTQNWFIK